MHLRFFVSRKTILNNNFSIADSGLVHQLTRVLRSKSGDELELLDGGGNVYFCRIMEIGRHEIAGQVLRTKFSPDNPPRFVALYLSLIKKDNFELVLQKGTELGVKIFIPMLAARSVKINDEIPARWREIVREAAEQCGRTELPEIKPVIKFKDAVKNFSGTGVLAHEEEKDLPISRVIDNEKNLSIFIGPEGGFSPEEIALAKSVDIKLISLGKNILRAETAAIAAAAISLL